MLGSSQNSGKEQTVATITFRLQPHSTKPNLEIVEILLDGLVCGVLYPDPDNENGGLKLVSAHFAGALSEGDAFPAGITMDNRTSFPPIPTLKVVFDPRPYEINGGGIARKPTS